MNSPDSSQPPGDDLALDFLEQWLASPTLGATPTGAPSPDSEGAPRTSDPSLRSIERLVAQHKDLFRRHAQQRPGEDI